LAAYTGKAAHVLARKTGRPTSTIHRLIYGRPFRDTVVVSRRGVLTEQERLYWSTRKTVPNLEDPKTYLVLDEVSMIGKRMGQDVESFGSPILVLGDPGQLPPVGSAGYFTNVDPDVMLTEIMRTDSDEIIDVATHVRNGGIPAYDPPPTLEAALRFDQVLVGTNATRQRFNTRARALLGFDDPLPVPGDRLICIRNEYRYGIFNGQQFTVETRDDVRLLLRDEDGDTGWVEFSADCLETPGPGCVDFDGHNGTACFTWAYAITCHKSQGSEWDRVLVVNESFGVDRHRWLYTAVTRAVEQVSVVRNVKREEKDA
jgi:exodeoxyribonuclease-5